MFRWGIIATGNIASKMAEALTVVDDAEIVAVGSRSAESAERFGARWNIPNRHDSYQGVANDPAVEIVYIATPHTFHYDNMLMCLNAGKHVLCEKPLALNARQAAECIALAREKGLFLMEAIWMRFIPAIQQVKQWVDAGTIGELQFIRADFNFHRPFDENHRLYNPTLGGGALLDLTIYPLSFTTFLVGEPNEVIAHAQLGRTGTDDVNTFTLRYDHQLTAQLSAGMRFNMPIEAYVIGTKGQIKVHDFFLRPNKLILEIYGQSAEEIDIPHLGNGYPHEVMEVHNCLRTGQIESPILPHAETLRMMKRMDQLRAEWGVKYPSE